MLNVAITESRKAKSVRFLTYSPIILSAAFTPEIKAVCVHPTNSKCVCSPAKCTRLLPMLVAMVLKSWGEDPTYTKL